jgi:hypothetical protein
MKLKKSRRSGFVLYIKWVHPGTCSDTCTSINAVANSAMSQLYLLLYFYKEAKAHPGLQSR